MELLTTPDENWELVTLGAEVFAVALGGGTTRCAPPSKICIDVHCTLQGSSSLRIGLGAGEIGSAVPITSLNFLPRNVPNLP